MSRLPHTDLLPDSLPPHVLVCGDPARADAIAAHLHSAELVAHKREYRTWRGEYNGRNLAVCSHGLGAPGAAVAFEELIRAGARALLRVGTCGSMQNDVGEGDLVIATAAVQWTGYGREVVPANYPAIADMALTHCLHATAQQSSHPNHTGLVLTRDAFFPGVATPYAPDYEPLVALNVLAVEMECAALFLVGSLRRVATAALLAVDGNVFAHNEQMDQFQPNRPIVKSAVDAAIAVALATLATYAESHV